jgi:hypothetical protein
LSFSGDAPAVLPITGGTGCFADTSGYVESVVHEDPNDTIFNTSIHIQEGVPEDCPDREEMEMQLFEENTSSDVIEGDGTLYGERIFWNDSPFNAKDGSQQATTSGFCTTVEESPVRYFCHYTSQFGEGPLSGSLLSFSGISVDNGDGAAIFPITGGTGCFAGASGYVESNVPDDPSDPILETYIHLSDSMEPVATPKPTIPESMTETDAAPSFRYTSLVMMAAGSLVALMW